MASLTTTATLATLEYGELTLVNLKVELVKRDLDTKGRKAALVKRLQENDAAAVSILDEENTPPIVVVAAVTVKEGAASSESKEVRNNKITFINERRSVMKKMIEELKRKKEAKKKEAAKKRKAHREKISCRSGCGNLLFCGGESLFKPCFKCNTKEYCEDCVHRCGGCGKDYCEDCVNCCGGCGNHYCEDCGSFKYCGDTSMCDQECQSDFGGEWDY